MPLKPPPRNDQGEVLPHDHDEISNDSRVIRRVHKEFIVDDPKAASGKRLSSITFSVSSGENGGMSVDLEQLIIEAGHDSKTYVTTPKWIASVHFQTGFLRAQELQVGFDPILETADGPANPCHGQVWGNLTKGVKKRLLEQCEWLVPHNGADIR